MILTKALLAPGTHFCIWCSWGCRPVLLVPVASYKSAMTLEMYFIIEWLLTYDLGLWTWPRYPPTWLPCQKSGPCVCLFGQESETDRQAHILTHGVKTITPSAYMGCNDLGCWNMWYIRIIRSEKGSMKIFYTLIGVVRKIFWQHQKLCINNTRKRLHFFRGQICTIWGGLYKHPNFVQFWPGLPLW